MKKILFAENAEKAESFIAALETQYLPAIRSLIIDIKKLGIAEVPKELVFDLINGNYEQLRAKYWEVANKDIEAFKSPAVREQTKRTAESMIEDFVTSIPGRFSVALADGSGRNLNNLTFQPLIEIDEAGTPIIPDPAKEDIRESFREYLSNPKVLKVYETQRQAAESIQAYLNALQDSKMDRFLFLQGPWLFLAGTFETETLKEEDSITGFKIKPAPLNFELLQGTGINNSFEKEEPVRQRFIDIPERRDIDTRKNR